MKGFSFATILALMLILVGTRAEAQDVTFDSLPALQVTTPIPGSNHVPNDFNGDGLSDLLWFNPTTSQMYYSLMGTDSSGAISLDASRIFNITSGYFVGATGDFNKDGFADLIFTSANRDLYLWGNDRHGGFVSRFVGTYPAGWQLVGAGDIDGDGLDDLLWMNASACQFGYWTMKDGVRTGARIVAVTCGYFPLSIGYYAFSNRISIMWTSAERDLWVWDSNPEGFTSYSLGNFPNGHDVIALGGGYAGIGVTYVLGLPYQASGSVGEAEGGSLSRRFDISGKQTSYTVSMSWTGGMLFPLSSAGFLIEGRGINKTGVIYQQGEGVLNICPPVATENPFLQPPAPLPSYCQRVPQGGDWKVVGALANGSITGASH